MCGKTRTRVLTHTHVHSYTDDHALAHTNTRMYALAHTHTRAHVCNYRFWFLRLSNKSESQQVPRMHFHDLSMRMTFVTHMQEQHPSSLIAQSRRVGELCVVDAGFVSIRENFCCVRVQAAVMW